MEARQVALPGGRTVTYLHIMSTKCLHCGEFLPGDIGFIAVGNPYNGVLHVNCAPVYSYPAAWPHPNPAVKYLMQ